MTPFLLEGPAVEPVTLAAMKEWLRIVTTDEDALILSLISAARLTVEAASGQILVAQKWRLTLDAWPSSALIRIPLRPVISCDAVRIYTGLSTSELVAPQSYQLDATSDPPRLLMNGPWPSPGRAMGGIEVDITAGYGASASAVPADLVQAVKLLTAYWFENRGDALGTTPPLPPQVVAHIAAFRRVRV